MAVKSTPPRVETKISFEGKVPPQNVEAEQSVLGSLLIDKDAIIKIAQDLKPEHFYREQHAEIYRAILTLFEKRQPADLVTVIDVLKKNNTLELAGGAGYLSGLVNSVPTSAHIEHYSAIVKEASTKRALIAAAAKITEDAFQDKIEVKDLLDSSEQQLFSISQEQLKQNFIPLKDALADSFDRLDELHKKGSGLRGVPTGFGDIDKKLSGLQDSTLIILAARPSVGKSTFCMNIAQYLGVKEKSQLGCFLLK